MPVLLPCVELRCPEYALPGKSRCAVHQREWDKGRWDRGGTGQRGSQHQPSQHLRRRVWVEQSERCADCSRPVKEFELHHIDGDARNNSQRNLRGLCPPCHKDADAKLRARRAALRDARRRKLQ